MTATFLHRSQTSCASSPRRCRVSDGATLQSAHSFRRRFARTLTAVHLDTHGHTRLLRMRRAMLQATYARRGNRRVDWKVLA